MKKNHSLITLILGIVGVVFILTIYSSCRFFNKNENIIPVKEIADNEEQHIARFLVDITNVNNKIIELSKFTQQETSSFEMKNFFIAQENKIKEIQIKINRIAVSRLITLPKYNENIKTLQFFDNNEATLTSKLIENLNKEINLFRKIKIQTRDNQITYFQVKYLPEIKSMLEETTEFKKQLNNLN